MNAVRIHKFGGGPQDLVYEEDVMQPHIPKKEKFWLKSMLQALHEMK